MQLTIDVDEAKLSIEEKGKIGEADFRTWLRSCGIAYMYVDQSAASFAHSFRDYIKRPDFLVPIESIGTIAVDVKNWRRQRNGEFTFSLGPELAHAENFERLFGMYVWYAYRSLEAGHAVVWYWISAHKAALLSKAAEQDAKYFKIEPHHFERVKTANDLSKLYTHMRRPR